MPEEEGGQYFYLRNDGTQDQSVLYVADGLNAPPRVLVDPNGKREDATIALSEWYRVQMERCWPTHCPMGARTGISGTSGASLTALICPPCSSSASSGQCVLGARQFGRVLQPLSAQARQTRPTTAERGDDAGRPDVYFHRLDESQASDHLIFQVTNHPTRVPSATVTEDGRYLIISIYEG